MKKILTGLQPSGNLTLGNYIGAIKQMVEYQNKYKSYIFVADMHAITVPQDPINLAQNIRNLLAIYLACGINSEKNTIFLQSENIYHANLSWIFECFTPYGELSRMTQFKDKSHKNQNFSAGLLTYPILMAADILLYGVDYVPVGKDQKQHVELARDIALRMNKKFNKQLFKLPEPLIPENGAKIMDLVDPSKKMSKSSDNPKGVIYLLDKEEDIRKKIMGATTDSGTEIKYDLESKPGISNLMTIYSCLSNTSIKEVEEHFKGYKYGDFKKEIADKVISVLKPIQEKYEYYLTSSEIDEILDNGKRITSRIAREKVNTIKQLVGLHR